MALNPSNKLDEGLKGFPTLGDPPFDMEHRDLAINELYAAGFPKGCEILTMHRREVYKKYSEPYKLAQAGIHIPGNVKPGDIETALLFDVEAHMHGWEFYRAWYYWVARTKTIGYLIPEDVAKKLNKKFRSEIRVAGYAGGMDVNGPVESYHIDTPRGLKAFVKLLKERYEIKCQKVSKFLKGA